MRGPLPLDDADFAAIRAQVMAKIETPKRAPVWRFALAALVLAVLSVVVGRQPAVRPSSVASYRVIPSVARDPVARVARPTPTQVPRYARHDGVARKRKPRPTRPPTPQLARIELQTADPDVRIIWITN